MATIVVTNLDTSGPIYLSDFSTALDKAGGGGANISRTFTRPAGTVPLLRGLVDLLNANKVKVEITPTAAEISSGLLTPPSAVQAGDVAPVDSLNTGIPFTGRLAFTAGGPQSVTIYDPATPKFPGKKFRITRAWARISTASGGTTVSLRTATGGGGTLLSQIASAATGCNAENTAVTSTTSVDMTNGTDGLFLYKSSVAPGGEIFWEGVLENI